MENATKTLNCCKKRRIPKTCVGLCVFDEGQGRDVAGGECMVYLHDIYDCLMGGKIFRHYNLSML